MMPVLRARAGRSSEMVAQLTPAIGLDLPLDIRGTAFQHRVWQALRSLPVGSTASYTAIAKSIGMPKSVRAVAQACAANALAVAIPCHRVVRTNPAKRERRGGRGLRPRGRRFVPSEARRQEPVRGCVNAPAPAQLTDI